MSSPTETTGWAYAMPVYSSFMNNSRAQVIADSPEECAEAMWAAKAEVDRYTEAAWLWWVERHAWLHSGGTPVAEGREEDIRVVPA